MDGETNMICDPRTGNPRSPSPPRAVARSLGDLVHDLSVLGELQTKLFRLEAKESIGKIVWPVILLALGGVFALSSLPILLTTFAFVLIEFARLSYTLSFLLAAVLGFVLAGILAAIGYFGLKNFGSPFSRSQAEMRRNLDWFRSHLKSDSSEQERHAATLS
jgi:hypothetical protein